MPNCNILKKPMFNRQNYRTKDGDITSIYYCYSGYNESKRNTRKRFVHPQCKENQKVVYENGKDYNLSPIVNNENLFPNLIKCWCQPNHVKGNQDNFPHDLEQHNLQNKQIMSLENLENPKID